MFHPVLAQQPVVLCTHAPALGPARLLPGFCIWCCFLIARYLLLLYSAVARDQRSEPHSSQACWYQMVFPCFFITTLHQGKESCRRGSTWLWVSCHLKTRPHNLILETCSFRAGFFSFFSSFPSHPQAGVVLETNLANSKAWLKTAVRVTNCPLLPLCFGWAFWCVWPRSIRCLMG